MEKITYIITDELGIHARPAGLISKKAGEFLSHIKILNEKTSKEADCKRIMAVMALGVKKGDRISIFAEGEDEKEAVSALKKFLAENLAEVIDERNCE